ncbi:MAG: DUF748 domain-containing protein [Rhodospirillales bacterium]|nr:DUF748 domain-containing protein [Rhodospirillales bacterium]
MKSSETSQIRKRARPLVWLGAFLCVAGLAAALWWGPSAALRYALDRSLAGLGYRVIGLGEVSVSLFERRIGLGRIELEQPGGGIAHLDLADLVLSPSAFFDGRIDVPHAHVSGLTIEIARGTDGSVRIAGLPVAEGKPPAAAKDDAPILALGIGDLEVANSRLMLRNGNRRIDVTIARLSVEGLVVGDPSAQAKFELSAGLGGRTLKIAGTAKPFAAPPTVDLRFETDGLALGPLAGFLGEELSGTLDAALRMKLEADGHASLDGTLTLHGPSFAGNSASSIAWRGNAGLRNAGRLQGKGTLDAAGLRLAADAVRAAAASGRYDGSFDVAIGGASSIAGTLELGEVAASLDGDDYSVAALRLEIPQLRVAADGTLAGRLALAAEAISGATRAGSLRVASFKGQGEGGTDARTQSFAGSVELVGPVVERAGERYAADRIGADSLRIERSDAAGTLRGAIAVDGLSARTADFDFAAAKARYDGSVDLRAAGPVTSGKLDAGPLRMAIPAADIVATLDAFAYEGSLAAGASAPTADGRVRLGRIRIVDGTARELFAATSVDVGGFTFGSAGAGALRIVAAEPRALRREKAIEGREAFGWRLRAPRASIEDARVSPEGGFAAGLVRFDQPTIRLTRTKNGLLSFERGAPPVPGTAAAPAAPSPGIAVGRFEIVNGRATFEDRTPHDTVRIPLERLTIAVTDIDDRRPGRPSGILFDARVGSFGTARLRGAAFPFAERLSFDIEFSARAIDLPQISAYADEALGVDVRTGTASIDGRIVAREEKLEGSTKWKLANVQLDERAGGAGALAEQAGAPIGLALSLLADDENNIELDIPVAGELYNPTFDTADAVRQAVGGALKGALSSTLTVLFPFGTFLSAAIDSERRGSAIVLPDVAFAPGANMLDGQSLQVVDGLAKLMAARPAARLEVCGFAGPGDAGALPRRPGARGPVDDDDLRRLAASRGEAVKRRLVESSQVDPARIFECRPVVEDAREAKPRAELKF